MVSETQKRLIWPDAIKVLACFFVVCLHSNGLALTAFESTHSGHSTSWWQLVFLNCICRFGVPVFLMVTGIFLCSPQRKIGIKKLRAYIFRIAAVLVVTSIVWSVLQIFFGQPNEEVTFSSFLRMTASSPYHMWYLWALLGIYLVAPVLRQIASSQTALYTALLVGGLVLFGQGLIEDLGDGGAKILSADAVWWADLIRSKVSLSVEVTFPCIYVLAGFWLANAEISKRVRIAIYSSGVLSFLIIYFLAWRIIMVSGEYSAVGNDSIFVALFSAAVFVWFKSKQKFSSFSISIVRYISPALLWTYAIHAVVLGALQALTPLEAFFRNTGLIGTAVVSIFAFAASVLIARGIERAKSLVSFRK